GRQGPRAGRRVLAARARHRRGLAQKGRRVGRHRGSGRSSRRRRQGAVALKGAHMATITIGIMDPPYESANTPTAFRLVEAAIRKGHNVNVFCYEGATALGYAGQKPHANAVHGLSLEEEDHPNPKEWVKSLLAFARDQSVKLVWFTHAMKNGGADVSILLRGDAVNYAVSGQDAKGLRFGARTVKGPDMVRDIQAVIAKKIPLYAVADDLAERGIPASRLIPGVE